MIEVNNTKFAKNEKELINSLFGSGSTASGTYKVKKTGTILFYDLQGTLFAARIANKYGEKFFVSARLYNNKPRFQFDVSDLDKQKLGIAGLTFGHEKAIAENLEVK